MEEPVTVLTGEAAGAALTDQPGQNLCTLVLYTSTAVQCAPASKVYTIVRTVPDLISLLIIQIRSH